MIGTRYTAPLFVFVLVSACATQRAGDTQTSVRSTDPVPPEAPDTTPAWFNDDTSYTTSPVHLKHMIGVTFRTGATQEERQAAIDAVGGKVVGGWRFIPNQKDNMPFRWMTKVTRSNIRSCWNVYARCLK